MSSNLRASTWSLRARLLIGQVLLLAAVCVGIAAITELALHQYLYGQLDDQLKGERAPRGDDVRRSTAAAAATWRDNRPPMARPGPGPAFLDAPGQPIGLVASIVDDGRTRNAGVLTAGGCAPPYHPWRQGNCRRHR